ncbi:MAG: hypothetical protein LBW85_09940 [Deltaproteobacteria bacterium]|jgi:type II secretory pathway pseudopilin PulG|nr:hypothetical protein [Deltaproteobacteria bacterium]
MKPAHALPQPKQGYVVFECLALLLYVLSIFLPQYSRYRDAASDNAAQSAYHAIATAEEAYFAEYGRYTDNYEELSREGGLVKDGNVLYGELTLYINPQTSSQGFKFSVRHKEKGMTVYKYDSASAGSTVTMSKEGLDSSEW